MIAPADLEACRAAIRTGSHSFHAASKLLPPSVRDPALALYAFCRLADDAVDLRRDKAAAVLRLRDRLELVYAGRPLDSPADRAFAAVVEDFAMPRALPEALLEGLAWDAMGRRCADLSALLDYSARVAAAVGVMMCVLMKVRDRHTLARAADLGLAMQLTNIARDVGEDAREGRLYLPLDWLADAGIDPEAFLAAPSATPALRSVVARLLKEAERLYLRADPGVQGLPLACRPGIFAAGRIYRGIGLKVAAAGFDSVTRRARTTKGEKLLWLAGAAARTAATAIMPRPATIFAAPAAETAYLVSAAARRPAAPGFWGDGRAGALIEVLAQLEARDRARRGEDGPRAV
ncbi:MAG: 15-cis-phytoene synthase [Pikeienuella sp.]|uniref:15-cis-phytoene synthase n=1 Tax=Pikeienuella sp. TaxID=2831957 RepID=UPI003918B934